MYYPSTDSADMTSTTNFATLGYTGATAINESSISSGNQQRANNIYAESTFICPSYWLSEAFTNKGRQAYKYQFSTLPALHGVDVSAIFGPPLPSQGPGFVAAFQRIWGNFVRFNDPSITTASVANVTNGTASIMGAQNWPVFDLTNPMLVNCEF